MDVSVCLCVPVYAPVWMCYYLCTWMCVPVCLRVSLCVQCVCVLNVGVHRVCVLLSLLGSMNVRVCECV